MPGQMPQPYEGNRPYIFACYAHADRDVVRPIIRALVDEGYRVWWDDSIELAEDYPDYIADHLYGCACLVAFVSASSLRSGWCTREIQFALDFDKRVLPIYLKDVELTRGLHLLIGHKQALHWHALDSDTFYRRLFKARRLEPCLTDEGKQRRGVKPRSAGAESGRSEASQSLPVQPEPKIVPEAEATPGIKPEDEAKVTSKVGPKTSPNDGPKDAPGVAPKAGTTTQPKAMPIAESTAETKAAPRVEARGETKGAPKAEAARGADAGQRSPIHTSCASSLGVGSGGRGEVRVRSAMADRPGVMPGVAKEDELAGYSWAELKELSRMIAAAGSDVAGLAIARAYHLVDKDGRLRGDEKPLQLRDGTKTSVRILGFRHDELAGGGKSGISFEFADVPATHRMNARRTNAGGWEGSEMRKWLNSEFLALLPGDVRPLIEAARKRTNNVGEVMRENDASIVSGTADKLWLLSMYEVHGRLTTQLENTPWSPVTYVFEGAQYKLYADKGVTTTSYGFCAKSGAHSWWWLRSPYASDSNVFLSVNSDGDWDAYCADVDGGVSPGFCL